MMRKTMTHFKQQIQTSKMQIKQNRLNNHHIQIKRNKTSKKKKKSNTNKINEKNKHISKQINDKKEEQNETKNPVISKREAIQKALEQFSGDVDDVDLEDEDGRLYYEIEIERGDLEAEIMIDA